MPCRLFGGYGGRVLIAVLVFLLMAKSPAVLAAEGSVPCPCKFEWAVSSGGADVGRGFDEITKTKGGWRIVAEFKPFFPFSLLAGETKRESVVSVSEGLASTYRFMDERSSHGVVSWFLWERNGDTRNGLVLKTGSVGPPFKRGLENEVASVDTLSIPYLSFLSNVRSFLGVVFWMQAEQGSESDLLIALDSVSVRERHGGAKRTVRVSLNETSRLPMVMEASMGDMRASARLIGAWNADGASMLPRKQ